MLTLLVVALLIFGPDKLPAVAKDAAQMLRTVRNMAKDARSQIKTELGPEFSEFDLDSLNPRSFVAAAGQPDQERADSLRSGHDLDTPLTWALTVRTAGWGTM
jgi:sec-independent protein translocase protein TatB